jgi:hypothetical protein
MKTLRYNSYSIRLLAAFGVAILALGFSATHAKASIWQLQDSFEVNAPSTWRLEHAGTGGGWFESLGQYSRTGAWDSYIWVASGFSSVGRLVSFTPFLPGRTLSAGAGIYLRPYGTNVRVNFEVIDPDTWTYIALKTVTLANSYTYQFVNVGPFVPYRKDVYVRVSVLDSGGVDVDDLTVQAVY